MSRMSRHCCLLLSSCRWLFETEDCDIGFGVLYHAQDGPDDKTWEEIVPINRVNSNLVPEDGNIVCNKVGICKLKVTGGGSPKRSSGDSESVLYFHEF